MKETQKSVQCVRQQLSDYKTSRKNMKFSLENEEVLEAFSGVGKLKEREKAIQLLAQLREQ